MSKSSIETPMRNDITKEEWIASLEVLRSARARLLKDSEAFHEAAISLEYTGQVLIGKIKNGLNGYTLALRQLAETVTGETEATQRLLDVVRESRNMAVHEGTWARHLSSRLSDLLTILETAVRTQPDMKTVEDIMVRSPIVAEGWHMLAQVRRVMLENSFTYLPVFHNGSWHLISDAMLVKYLHSDEHQGKPNERLAESVKVAISRGKIIPDQTVLIHSNTLVSSLIKNLPPGPVLIFKENDDPTHLVGILTPFDLL